MKVIVIPVGSSGDVHPLLGISLELRKRGHEIVFITNGHFEKLARSQGLTFESIGTAEEYHEAINDPDIWHPTRGTKKVLKWSMVDLMRPSFGLIRKHFNPGQTIIVSAAICLGARIAHDVLGVPLVTTQLQPMAIYSHDDPPQFPVVPEWAPKWLKRLMYWIGDHAVINPIILPPLNDFRKELGLAPLKGHIFSHYINSPQLVLGLFPEWFATPAPDWPPQLRMTGFPLYDEKGVATVAPELNDFLHAGAPPIVFTPGSAMRQGLPFFKAAADACRFLGRRGLLLSRYPENIPASLPEGVRYFSYAPFSEVLPRCAALVHHGGIGTMAQALAAGIPQLVMPMAHDQPDNAARIKRLGVGLSIKRSRFTGANVAARLKELLVDPSATERAKAIARKFDNIRPIGQACDYIEELARSTGVLKPATALVTPPA